MKKTYIQPNMICVKLVCGTMIAGSLTGEGLNMRINNGTTSGSADSRSNDWDDEDDDY